MSNRSWFKAGLLCFVVVSMSVAAHAARPDSWITMKAKTALYVASDVKGTDINVDTINGVVMLHGTVSSEEEKRRAEEEVRKIEGVSDVRNLLQVVPKSKQERVERSDEQIKDEAQKALRQDQRLKDSDINVKSVNKGVVLLSGHAASPSDHLRALHIVRATPGVLRAASEVQVPDNYSDDEFRTDLGTSQDKTGRTTSRNDSSSGSDQHRSAGTAMSDTWITSATKIKLAADSRTPANQINVDTYDGTVILFGMVPSKESKAAATEIAQSVTGVRKVDNKLEVVAQGRQSAVQAKDDTIQKEVEQTLKARGAQDNADIDVEVSNGVVRLTGTVPTWERSLSAVMAARSVNGVHSVRNELKVESDRTS